MPPSKHQAHGSFSLFPAPQTYNGSPPLPRAHRPSIDASKDSPSGQNSLGSRVLEESQAQPKPPASPPVSSEQSRPEPLPFSSSFSQLPQPPPPTLPSRSSIAKLPLSDDHSSAAVESSEPPAIRSIFPVYNPDVPLASQNYFPTQASPTRVRRSIISRPLYSPRSGRRGSEEDSPPPPFSAISTSTSPAAMALPASVPASSTGETRLRTDSVHSQNHSGNSHSSQWPFPRDHPPAVSVPQTPLPKTSSANAIKGLWKVANGWRATEAEGHVYCLELSQERDTPFYTLSAESQPFYSFKLDPTSTSARVALARLDPAKASRAEGSYTGSASKNKNKGQANTSPNTSKYWQQALSAVLEEDSRRQPPNDGLVALLYPAAAQEMALTKAHDAAAVKMAENECARLVWDTDSSTYYLVHPALAAPFYVSISRSTGGSARVEYTLEHHESPQHLAKLTRDGSRGPGCLQIDTGLASKIEAFFIVDVAVTALMLVANGDEHNLNYIPVFEPPPQPGVAGEQPVSTVSAAYSPGVPPPAKLRSRLFRSSSGDEAGLAGSLRRLMSRRRWKNTGTAKSEEFELDIESQSGSWYGQNKHGASTTSRQSSGGQKKEEKLPWPLRVVVSMVKGVLWVVVMFAKTLLLMGKGMAKCLGVKY
ncbi:hypothetical protein CFIMG_008501RA00001 [Ceratocystis fimbriata CBS 114723]|uniref:Acetylserotonin methytransferase-like protein n=1 Tax=Ceratocystis fimbriata CBS 114723 TaxID=1035309 RepID=A0A2C5XI27_9PEZI|nr:hypothetical protein CFIMG_008501RA00001 [Ceratocystis fimbriata CBS 114723]